MFAGNWLVDRTWNVLPLLAQDAEAPLRSGDRGGWTLFYLGAFGLVLIAAFIMALVLFSYGKLWVQAVMSNAHVSLLSLVGMSLRQVHARTIVEAKIMAMQAAVGNDPHTGITTRRLEAHYLAGGNVPRVIHALIAAHRADIDLDFDWKVRDEVIAHVVERYGPVHTAQISSHLFFQPRNEFRQALVPVFIGNHYRLAFAQFFQTRRAQAGIGRQADAIYQDRDHLNIPVKGSFHFPPHPVSRLIDPPVSFLVDTQPTRFVFDQHQQYPGGLHFFFQLLWPLHAGFEAFFV